MHSYSIIDVDACASNPCAGGSTCIARVSNYTCECQPGYTGLTCHTGTCSYTIMDSNSCFVVLLLYMVNNATFL
jgi:hypothetical protein